MLQPLRHPAVLADGVFKSFDSIIEKAFRIFHPGQFRAVSFDEPGKMLRASGIEGDSLIHIFLGFASHQRADVSSMAAAIRAESSNSLSETLEVMDVRAVSTEATDSPVLCWSLSTSVLTAAVSCSIRACMADVPWTVEESACSIKPFMRVWFLTVWSFILRRSVVVSASDPDMREKSSRKLSTLTLVEPGGDPFEGR